MRYGSPVNLSFRLPVALWVASLVFTSLWAVENPDTVVSPPPTSEAVAAAVESKQNDEPAGSAAGKPDAGNPFIRLTSRNAFGIKPPPPPAPILPTVVSNPPVTLPIFVTGFSMLKGAKKVYLVVNRPGAKGPDYVTAAEGEEFDGFQVVAIDPRKETVRVLNGGNEVTLNFKDNGMKAVAGGIAPGQGVPVPVGGPRQAAAGGGVGGGGPTIIGRGAAATGVIGAGAVPNPSVQAPTEIRSRGSVITGGPVGDPTVPTAITPVQSGYVVPAGGFQEQPVPVPRTRPAPPPPPLPGL